MTKTAQKKMSDYRDRLRAAGLRPIQIWVRDMRRPKPAEEARRQSLLASATATDKEALDFIEEVADLDDAE